MPKKFPKLYAISFRVYGLSKSPSPQECSFLKVWPKYKSRMENERVYGCKFCGGYFSLEQLLHHPCSEQDTEFELLIDFDDELKGDEDVEHEAAETETDSVGGVEEREQNNVTHGEETCHESIESIW
jgi:hypothetical protein